MVNSRQPVVKGKSTANELASKYHINEHIRADQVFVVDENGENLGLISKNRALILAQEASLDLVQVGVKDDIPVTKIMDFGKFLYLKKKKETESKKHQKVVQLKEIKLRPNIDEGDFQTKLRHAEEFFKEGKKVKFTLQFKGREIATMSEVGLRIFERITAGLDNKKIGNLIEEKEQKSGAYWSKIYFVKKK